MSITLGTATGNKSVSADTVGASSGAKSAVYGTVGTAAGNEVFLQPGTSSPPTGDTSTWTVVVNPLQGSGTIGVGQTSTFSFGYSINDPDHNAQAPFTLLSWGSGVTGQNGGVTCTDNKDGTFTVKATAAGSCDFGVDPIVRDARTHTKEAGGSSTSGRYTVRCTG